MKKRVWRDGNHMLFESAHLTFNRQVDCISTGNVLGHVQVSFYIRPWTEVECNGRQFPEGHLRDADLAYFENRLPTEVREAVCLHAEDQSVILYEFRHWSGKEKIVHGYVITTGDKKLIRTFTTRPALKSRSVIVEATKYICEEAQA